MNVGIVGLGLYLPKKTVSARDIALATCGNWSEQAIIDKLGIVRKYVADSSEGTQEMGVLASLDCLHACNVDAKDIDVVLCVGEEWKEYLLTTSANYIINRIGAVNAWGVDLQNRCSTTVTAMKIAKDMLMCDSDINTILICGGYRNGDLVDYADPDLSMLYDLSAGGGAMLLRKNYGRNLILNTKIITDGMLHDSARVEYGGQAVPYTEDNVHKTKSLHLVNPSFVKDRLTQISKKNWLKCIDTVLSKSSLKRADIDYLDILHIKRSAHNDIMNELGLDSTKSIYLEDYGHMGQIDQILSLKLALENGKIHSGNHICMVSAGVGGVWASNIIKWG